MSRRRLLGEDIRRFRNEIKMMSDRGMTHQEIADTMFCSRQNITKHLKILKEGVDHKKELGKFFNLMIGDLRTKITDLKSLSEMACEEGNENLRPAVINIIEDFANWGNNQIRTYGYLMKLIEAKT